METDRYPISELVADLKRVCAQSEDEMEILIKARPLAHRAALSKASWFEDRMYHADPEQGFGVHLLHEEPDHTLAIFAVSWLPHRGTPPHDHGTWGLVAGVEGEEKNEFFQRIDDHSQSGHAELKRLGEKAYGPGSVLAMPRSTVHRVWNDTDSVSVSLHIYGKNINYTGRSQFDLEAQTEMPFILKMED